MESTAEAFPKQQNSSASLASENGGRRVARFNVTTPVGVTASAPVPVGDVAAADDPIAAVGDRDRERDVSPSRFRVEFVDEVAPGGEDCATVGSGGGTAAGGHSSYDTHQKTFGHNTLETLPHADHYRNILSATGNIRKRPTLLELHELAVRLSVSFSASLSLQIDRSSTGSTA